MAERWERERDRGFTGRAADEVRSWFGDEEAERRRHMDAREARNYGGEERWGGREGYRDRDRDYRSAGETALGRPDWASDRDDRAYVDRDRLYGSDVRGRSPYSAPTPWRTDYT